MPTVRFQGDLSERTLRLMYKALAMHDPSLSAARDGARRSMPWHVTELDFQLQHLLKDYEHYPEEWPRTRIEWWMKRSIRHAYTAAYCRGRNHAGNFTPDGELEDWEKRSLLKMRRREYVFLRAFIDDVDEGRGKMSYERRMRMYADALQGAFWLGFVAANRSNRRRIHWVYHPEAAHCEQCKQLDGMEWTPLGFLKWYRRYHILPGKGTTVCRTAAVNYVRRFPESFLRTDHRPSHARREALGSKLLCPMLRARI